MNEAPTPFLEQLLNTEFINGDSPDEKAIEKASLEDIYEFVDSSSGFTDFRKIQPATSLFSHTAALSLGGGRTPCINLPCRLRRAENLAQIAAFYSDQVFVRNVLSDGYYHLFKDPDENEAEIRQRFAHDLKVQLHLFPYFQAGIIIPVSANGYCPHCMANLALGEPGYDKIKSAAKQLVTEIIKDITSARVTRDRHWGYGISLTGSEKYLEHGHAILTLKNRPKFLTGHPRLLTKLKNDGEVILSRDMIRKSGIAENIASDVIESVIFEMIASRNLQTSYLTDRPVEIDLIRSMGSKADRSLRDQFIAEQLTAMVPFLETLSPNEIFNLRDAEQDSFILFRKALGLAVDESFRKNSNMDPESRAREIRGEILDPAISRLNNKLAESKALRRRIIGGASAGISLAALTIGTSSALTGQPITSLAAAIGLTPIASTLIANAVSLLKGNAHLKNEDFYFLWKANHLSQGRE